MSYYLSQSPLLQEFIHQIAKNNEDELSYEIWRDVCIKNGWIEINIQQDDWVDSIRDATKQELIRAYNSLNQDLKWNTKKKEKVRGYRSSSQLNRTGLPHQRARCRGGAELKTDTRKPPRSREV